MQEYKIRTILRKHIKKLFWRWLKVAANPIFVILGFMIFIPLTLLKPLLRIRIGKLEYARIGHLAANTELFLRRQSQRSGGPKELQIFVTGKPANRQILQMIKRKIFVSENRLFLKLYDAIYPYTSRANLWIKMPFETKEHEEFSTIPAQLSFTEEEALRGGELLKNMGINGNSTFVCFHSRDRVYLDKTHPGNLRNEWSYHDFRDCDISNYLSAAEYLASKGIYAVRMGYMVEKDTETKNNRIINYAKHFRSDFADIYLAAKCKFFLGSTAGLHVVPTIFNMPVALANAAPLGDMGSSKNDIFIPKKLWSKDKSRFLTFREIIAIGADWWLDGNLYTQANIEVIENSKEEILALTKEMDERLDGAWVAREEDENLQQRFRDLFPPGHRCYGFLSRIGTEFLRQNQQLLK